MRVGRIVMCYIGVDAAVATSIIIVYPFRIQACECLDNST